MKAIQDRSGTIIDSEIIRPGPPVPDRINRVDYIPGQVHRKPPSSQVSTMPRDICPLSAELTHL